MEVLRRLRAAGNDVPVVVITAHDSVANAVEAMKLGANRLPQQAALARVAAPTGLRGTRTPSTGRAGAAPPRDQAAAARYALERQAGAESSPVRRAKRLLREAIKERPDAAEPWYLLGVLHEVEHRPAEAKKAYLAALGIDPGLRTRAVPRHEIRQRKVTGTAGEIFAPDVEVDAMGQACRILIVEDEPNIRLGFRTALESEDYALATASDGETALRWF